jgi:hypothetical protein
LPRRNIGVKRKVIFMVEPVDLVELSVLWEENWPDCSKVPYELPAVQDRWIRLHTLPESKRYAETPDEYEIILARHNTVLAELVTGPEILLVTTDYSSLQEPKPIRSPQMSAAQPGGAHWVSICTDDELGSESWLHLYVSRMQWSVACLDPVLRQVADDEMANVVVMSTDLRWLYHPYDGGVDVLLPSTRERDALKARHCEWLSTHPGGW